MEYEKNILNHIERLTAYDWPGNVRELRNMLERLSLTVDDSIREIEEIPDAFFKSSRQSSRTKEGQVPPVIAKSIKEPEVSLKEQVRLMEKQIIQEAIDKYTKRRIENEFQSNLQNEQDNMENDFNLKMNLTQRARK